MRPNESRNLTWAMYDQEGGTLRLDPRAAKIGKGRVLALEGPLRDVIDRRLLARRLDCPLIFHRTSKGRTGQPIRDYRRAWAAACKAAGLVAGRDEDGGLVPYDLRRCAIRNMVRGGTDFTVAMKISGHKTRSTFDRYNIVSEDDIREAVLRTAAYVSGLPTDRKVVPMAERRGGHGQNADNARSGPAQRTERTRDAGGSGWESNPPPRGLNRGQTALKAARVTRPESLPAERRM